LTRRRIDGLVGLDRRTEAEVGIRNARLDRVMIMVDDLDAAVERWSTLLDTEFTVVEAAEFGVRAALSDSGVELVAGTVAGDQNEVAKNAAGVLAGICFRVDDIEEAKEEAQAQGLVVYPGFDIGVPGVFRECGFAKESFGGIPFALQEFPGASFTEAVFAMGAEAPAPAE
jgi:predicted enzyme related to lactoylglutathione lyase